MASLFTPPYFDVGAGITPADGALLNFYVVGSGTRKNTFTTSAATVAHENPVEADTLGVFDAIYLSGDYDWVLTNKNGEQKNTGSVSEFVTGSGQLENVLSRDTLNDAVIDTSLQAGLSINIKERTTGNGGGAMWDVVLSSTVTENTYNIVQCSGVATLSLVLRVGLSANVLCFGALPEDDSNYASAANAAANYGAIRAAIEYIAANNVPEIYFPKGTDGSFGYFFDTTLRIYTDGITVRFDTGVKLVKKYTETTTGTNLPASPQAHLNVVRRVGDVWSGDEILTGTQINNLTLINLHIDGSRQVWDTQVTSSNNSGFNGPTNLNLIFVKDLVMINCKGTGAYKFDVKMHSCQDFYIDFYETINAGGMGIAWTGGNKRGYVGGYYAETWEEGVGASGVGRAIHGFDIEPDDSAVSGNDVFDYETSDIEVGNGTIKAFQSGFSVFPNPNASGAIAKMDVKRVSFGKVNIVASTSDNTALVTIGDGNVIRWENIDITLGEIDAGAEGGTRITNGAAALLCENVEHLKIYGGGLLSYVDGAPTDAVQFNSCRHLEWTDFNLGVPNVGGDGIVYANCFNVNIDGFVTMADNSPAHQISRDSNTTEWENITISGTIERGYLFATRNTAGALCSGLTIPYLNYKGHSTGDFIIDIKHDIYNISVGPVKRVEPTGGVAKIRLEYLDAQLPCRNLMLDDYIDATIDYGSTAYSSLQIALIHQDIFRSNTTTETLNASGGAIRLAIFEANSTVLSVISNPRYGQTITLYFQGTGNTLTNNALIKTSTGSNKAFGAGTSTKLIYLSDSTSTSKWCEITH